VRTDCGRVEPDLFGIALDEPGNRAIGHRLLGHDPLRIGAIEQRTRLPSPDAEPFVKPGAGLEYPPRWHSDDLPFPLLIGLRMPDGEFEPFAHQFEIGELQRHKLRAPQRRSQPQRHHGPVPDRPRALPFSSSNHSREIAGEDRAFLARRPRALLPADPGKGISDHIAQIAVLGCSLAGLPVVPGNRRQMPPDRAVRPPRLG